MRCAMCLCTLILTLSTLSDCIALLNANFDDDPMCGHPSANSPGYPAGDMIWVTSAESEDVADMAMVNGDIISDNSLQYSNFNVHSLLREVRFFSKETDLNGEFSWTIWNGKFKTFLKVLPRSMCPSENSKLEQLAVNSGRRVPCKSTGWVMKLRAARSRFGNRSSHNHIQAEYERFDIFGLGFAAGCTK